MSFIADTHTHLYPVYPLGGTLIGAEQALGRLAAGAGDGGAARVILLAESRPHRVFSALRAGSLVPERADVTVAPGAEAGALRVRVPGGDLHVLAGRQIVAAERVEILALTVDADIPDGLPLAQVVTRVLDAGGVPVLAWALGKWLFARRRAVDALLQAFGPEQLLVGDSAMRPVGWGEPAAMQAARRRGHLVLAGSDPLPFAGDERHLGTYSSLFSAVFDPDEPVTSVRRALRDRATPPRTVGNRGGIPTVASRFWHHARAKR